jgi:hypothetical protein
VNAVSKLPSVVWDADLKQKRLSTDRKDRSMKGLLFAAALGAAAMLSVSAQALPLSSASQDLSSGAPSTVLQVAEGCGRGWHRNVAGRCVRNLSRAHGPCWWVRGPAGGWRLVCG